MLAVGRAVRARMVGRDVSRAFRARPHLYGHAHLLSEAGLLCPDRRCAVSGFSCLAAIYGSRSAWRTVCGACLWLYCAGDRKSVVSGKGVSVRVDLGGSRIIKK